MESPRQPSVSTVSHCLCRDLVSTRVVSWSELSQKLQQFVEEQLSNDEHWIFRGQGDAGWCLTPSLERQYSENVAEVEERQLREFKAKAHLYEGRPLPEDTDSLSWLALMRHQGVPSRLLDWSMSPFVACYFSFDEKSPREDRYASVWAVNLKALCKKGVSIYAGHHLRVLSDGFDLSSPGLFDSVQRQWRSDERLFVCSTPRLYNSRVSAQMGLFLWEVLPQKDFCQGLQKMIGKENIRKWEFPASLCEEALRSLMVTFNIHPGSLFNDIHGLAELVALREDLIKNGASVSGHYWDAVVQVNNERDLNRSARKAAKVKEGSSSAEQP